MFIFLGLALQSTLASVFVGSIGGVFGLSILIMGVSGGWSS